MPDNTLPPVYPLPQIETDPEKIAQIKENIKLLAALLKQRREAEACEDSLRTFIKAGWPIIGAGSPYLHNWHVDCLCEHLEAVIHRDIRSLIINMPPRFGKSAIVSVALSA